MSKAGLRNQTLTVCHDELDWCKLGEPNNKRRIVRLLNTRERQLLPAKIELCNNKYVN